MVESELLLEEDRGELLEQYSTKIKELKTRISEIRKEGKDPLIAAALLRNVKSKMVWAKHNGERVDFEKIESIFEKVQKEIIDAAEKPILNIKKEIEEKVEDDLREKEAVEALNEKSLLEKERSADMVKFSEEKGITFESVPRVQDKIKQEKEKESEQLKEKKKELVKQEFETVPASKDHYFFLHNGEVLTSLDDFIESLSDMSDVCFDFHMRNIDNDFSKWIAGIFHDDVLAKKIKGVTTKEKMKEIVEKYKRGE